MESALEREPLLEARSGLERCFQWMLALRQADGRVMCPEHDVEHSGKNAGLIVMAIELARCSAGPERERLIEIALQQGDRLVANLKREGTSECFTFRPGRHDPFNCSNSVIDGGAAADALGTLVRELEGECADDRLAAYRAASLKHARTYLRYAVLDKGVPAQRAWGLTGLASACRLERDPELLQAAAKALDLLQDIQHADGSYPYHPMAWGAQQAGASDVSAYYQSRVTAFGLWALADLEAAGRAPQSMQSMRRGLEFLLALQGPDGIKCGLVEAKPWYWGANHEVASHPFDVAALALGWQRFGDPRYAQAALRALAAWTRHLDGAGAPRSHLAGVARTRSYQCPVFWAGHAMWIARALPLLGEFAQVSAGGECAPGPCATYFEQASLVRLEDERVVAWVRGSRPGVSVAHGSPVGAGLLRVLRKRDACELLERSNLEAPLEAEWCGQARQPAVLRGWRACASDLRFSLWLARVHWRAGRVREALRAPLGSLHSGVLACAGPRVSSAHHLSPRLECKSTGRVQLTSALAWRAGDVLQGTVIERDFSVDGHGLLVSERVLQGSRVKGLDYRVPALALQVERGENEIRYRLA